MTKNVLHNTCITATAICSLCTGWAAFAQSSTGDNNSITVTGTRFPTPIDQVGRAVSIITAEEIDTRQQRFLHESLQTVPGVQLTGTGGTGSLTSISLRGLPSNQTLVVQDGIVLNNPSSFGNSFNFSNFDTLDIQRIEVLRGAQSTLYGSDAIGGVINIITKDGRDGLGGTALLEGGSFGSIRGNASLYGGHDKLSGRISIGAISTDGFSSADEDNGNTEADAFKNFTVSSKLRFMPTDNLNFKIVARYQDSEYDFDGFSFGIGPIDSNEIGKAEELSIAGFATHIALDGVLENRLSVAYLSIDQVNLDGTIPTFDALGTRIAYEYQTTIKPIEQISFIAGAEFDQQESIVSVGFGGNQKIETISGYGLLQVTPLSFWTLNAGIRHDDSDSFGAETTFSLSSAVEVAQTGTFFRASYAEGFRAPTAGELGFNPSLFAEFSDGWDVSIEQNFFNHQLTLQATYFDQHIDDMIAFDLADFTFVNVQEFSSKGIEISGRVLIANWMSVFTAYTYVDAVNLSTTLTAGNQPKNRLNFEVDIQPTQRLSLSAGINFNGSEIDGTETLDSFTVVTLRGAYEVNDNFEVFTRIGNVLNSDYQDNFGYGTAPISAFGGVRAKF